jgi:hypothetical protein
VNKMAASLFHKKIKCVHCGGNFKARKDNGKTLYICSRISNYGADSCRRIPIYEDFLLSVLEKRFQRELTNEEIRENVLHIEIVNKMLFTVYLKDQEPIVYETNHIIF